MNRVTLIGNLGADPELRHTASGTAVANIRLATNRKYKNSAGDLVERVDWHRLTLWGRQAEVASQYLTKGRQIAIEGRIEYSRTGEGEEAKYFTDIVVEKLELLGRRPGESDEAPNENAAADSDDVPF